MKQISVSEYNYHLPEDRIAKQPLDNRDESKLLIYKQGDIKHEVFKQCGEFLPEGSVLVFNNTKVIHARMQFFKETGARIEIFCLSPVLPTTEVATAMNATSETVWECMVGNKKKWKNNETLLLEFKNQEIEWIKAELLSEKGKVSHIKFSWMPAELPFSRVLEIAGKLPLPPYMNRDAREDDEIKYQTVYAKNKGAVAAPTAGLHFTTEVLEKLKQQGHEEIFLTLHISAGTFQPISVENALEHPMHNEQMVFTKETIARLKENVGRIIAIGTTSMRSLESLYWFGAELIAKGEGEVNGFHIQKLQPYNYNGKPPGARESLTAIEKYMDILNIEELVGDTSIFIFPGYDFKMVNGLFTNFHLPQSTLILLVAAFIGDDWKRIYESALEKGYRFLSYGDSSLLLP